MSFHANGDHGENYQADDHGALDVIGNEGDAKSTKR